MESRNGAFSLGSADHDFHMQVPFAYHPFSVLDQFIRSPNGMSEGPTGADRRLYGGGMLPSPNGTSLSTWRLQLSTNPSRND